LNNAFSGPVVETRNGGQDYGGSRLTPLGTEILSRYRKIEQRTAAATQVEMAGLVAFVKRRA
jgi:molybdate transport system regulatory protein